MTCAWRSSGLSELSEAVVQQANAVGGDGMR